MIKTGSNPCDYVQGCVMCTEGRGIHTFKLPAIYQSTRDVQWHFRSEEVFEHQTRFFIENTGVIKERTFGL